MRIHTHTNTDYSTHDPLDHRIGDISLLKQNNRMTTVCQKAVRVGANLQFSVGFPIEFPCEKLSGSTNLSSLLFLTTTFEFIPPLSLSQLDLIKRK